MKRLRLLSFVLLLALPLLAAEDPEILRESFLLRLNQERAAAGLPALRLVDSLNQVAQRSAEAIRERKGEPLGADSMIAIRRDLARAGYVAHGWSHNFAAGPGDAEAIVSWWKDWNAASFEPVTHPDYQDLGVGISELDGAPLYTFLLAWRESEHFARETAPLLDLEQVRAAMLARVNAQRKAAGALPLALDSHLNDVAQKHAEDMLSRSYYDHQSPEGLLPRDRVLGAGYPAALVAENIARGPTSVDEVMSAWLQSRGHRANLLNRGLTEIGVGCAVGLGATGDTVLWVQDFGRPSPGRSGFDSTVAGPAVP